jgi:DNA-binding NarL/FixJ family response regulator
LSRQEATELALRPDLVAAGETVQEGRAHAGPRLTPREREVAALVAQGCSNREIAERLVVGMRTVETHLEHIFTKLGVRSRSEVAVWVVQNEFLVAGTRAGGQPLVRNGARSRT